MKNQALIEDLPTLQQVQTDPEKRRAYGARLYEMIKESIDARGAIEQRWEANEAIYNNEPAPPRDFPFPGASNRHIPLSQPKQDALIAAVVGGLTSRSPYFAARAYGPGAGRAEALENTMHFFLKRADFANKVRLIAKDATNCSRGFFRLRYERTDPGEDLEGEAANVFNPLKWIIGVLQRTQRYQRTRANRPQRVGLAIDPIHPKLFFAWPTWARDLADAKIVGHLDMVRVQEIRELAKAGIYIEEAAMAIRGGDDAKRHIVGKSEGQARTAGETVGPSPLDEPVEVAHFTVKDDLNGDGYEEMYLVAMAFEDQQILRIVPYELSRTWYFSAEFHVEHDRFWYSQSLAYNLQGPQLAYNDIWNLMEDAVTMSVAPPIFVPESGITPDGKQLKYRPGTVNETDGAWQPTSLNVRVDLSPFPLLLEKLEQKGDEVARVSRTMTGGQLKKNITATEAARIAQSDDRQLDDYHATFAGSFVPMVELAAEMLTLEFADWKSYFGDAVPAKSLGDMAQLVEWEPTGQSPMRSPGARMQGAMLLAQFANDPEFGVRKWQIAREIIAASALDNNDDIQIPMEVLQQLMGQAAERADEDIAAVSQGDEGSNGRLLSKPGVGGVGGEDRTIGGGGGFAPP